MSNWIGPVGRLARRPSFCSCSGAPPTCFRSCWRMRVGWCTPIRRMPDSRSRLNTLLRAAGFVLTLLTSCGLATLHWDGIGAAQQRRRRARRAGGQRLRAGLEFSRRDVAAARRCGSRAWRCSSACRGSRSWTRSARWVLQGIDWARAKIDQRRELAFGQQRKQARQEVVREEQKKVASRPPPRIEAAAPRAREERAGGARAPGAAVRCAEIAANCRRCRCSMSRRPREQSYSDEALEAMSRLVELKLRDFGVEAEVVAVAAGPGDHALRAAPGARRQGQPDQQPRQGSGARAVRDQRAGGGDHPRQVGRGPGDSQREARDRHARRDHQIQALRRGELAARARARQGHRRRARWSRIWRACRIC